MRRCWHLWRYRNTIRFWISPATEEFWSLSEVVRMSDQKMCEPCAHRLLGVPA